MKSSEGYVPKDTNAAMLHSVTLAKSFLSVQDTSASSEHLFFSAGNSLKEGPDHVDMLTFLHYNNILI